MDQQLANDDDGNLGMWLKEKFNGFAEGGIGGRRFLNSVRAFVPNARVMTGVFGLVASMGTIALYMRHQAGSNPTPTPIVIEGSSNVVLNNYGNIILNTGHIESDRIESGSQQT